MKSIVLFSSKQQNKYNSSRHLGSATSLLVIVIFYSFQFAFQKIVATFIYKSTPKMAQSDVKDLSSIQTLICVVGNDGTGKSTIMQQINQTLRQIRPDLYCIERSQKNCPNQYKPILAQLKRLDEITFNYAFENERGTFERSDHLTFNFKGQNGVQTVKTVNIYWFILDLEPQKIQKRLKSRKIVDIYDSKKAVEYYSFIYREFAWYYGIPLIHADQPTNTIVEKIINSIEGPFYKNVFGMRFQKMNLNFVNQRNIENQINWLLEKSPADLEKVYHMVQEDIYKSKMSQFYMLCSQFKELFQGSEKTNNDQIKKFKCKLASRWLLQNGTVKLTKDDRVSITYWNQNQNEIILILEKIAPDMPYFKIREQGESKILYSIHSFIPEVDEYFKGKVIILLKSTIYSHTKQHTGEIPNLGKIRALGNILFLQMMRRNNLSHAYICINHENGIILSQLVKTSQLQIVFKKELLGTDKHSYHGINKIPQIVDEKNCYTSGVYVRFDWRNPNHFMPSHPGLYLNQDPYYYVVEKYFGKELFFKLFLTNSSITPIGDKCVTEDLLSSYVNTAKLKKNTLKVYTTFSYYSRKIGLQILDGCLMFDMEGQVVWSEINPDCMRVKSIKENQDYDKDIWRYGGSSKKEQIVNKWNLFNKLFIDWFEKNRFNETQLLELPQLCFPYQQVSKNILSSNPNLSTEYASYYRSISSPRWNKRLIGTIDISDGKPILVKSSVISESHNEESLAKAYEHISLLQELVLVDIDAAINKDQSGQKNNREKISQLVKIDRNKVLGVGGGIRNEQVLNYYLNKVKCRNIILSSNLDLLKIIKKQDVSSRVIVELSINQNNEVLIKGRSQNTRVNVITKILELIEYGVKTVSITFNHREGHLTGIPRKQLVQLHSQIPSQVQNIIIAGGITSIDDLNFIWGFRRCIPQLGSAIWKNKISIPDIYEQMVKFNNEGLIVTIIVDEYSQILGQVYMNEQALRKTSETRKLHRYSREHQRVMKKGDTSSNVFDVLSLKLDCDNDSIIVKVKPQTTNKDVIFCHQNQFSCFHIQAVKKDLNQIQSHILNKKQTGSGYSKRMMQNQGLAAMKIIEQVQQLHISEHNKVHEAADLMAHLMMYFNAHNVSFNQILSELEKRSIDTIKLQKSKDNGVKSEDLITIADSQQKNQKENLKVIGVIGGKHFERIDKLTEEIIGVKIIRASNRSAKISYQIKDTQLYDKTFGGTRIQLVGIKSKDMTTISAKGLISSCINYSIMMQNYPTVCKQVHKIATPGIILALLGRKNEEIDPKQWTKQKKGIIVCEYPFSVNKYLKQLGVDESVYTLIRVSGGTQSYLTSDTLKADFCDAIVESGKTVQDNDLRIVVVLEQTIYAGFYEAM